MSAVMFRKARANPFDKTALGAKIPDAKSTVSNALRFQGVKEVSLPAPVVNGSAPTLAFFPGVNNTFSVYGSDLATRIVEGHYLSMPTPVLSTTGEATRNANPMEKFRIVSAGLRVQLINNADENDGWFEAVRVEPGWDSTDKAAFTMPDPLTAASTSPITLNDVGKVIPAPDTWANHPTYVTGKLRDIHQYMWKLNSTSLDHEYTSVSTTDKTGEENIDPNYDIVLIRFRGRSDTTTPSKIVIHQCTNYEIVFETGTLLSTVATATKGRTLASSGDMTRPAMSRRNYAFGYVGKMSYRGRGAKSYRRTYKRKAKPMVRKRRMVRYYKR